MALGLTEADKERCRYHMGYSNVNPEASTQLGFPAVGEASRLLEQAMNRLRSESIGRVQGILSALDAIEHQMITALKRLKAIQVDEIRLSNSTNDATEQDRLESEYQRWQARLARIFGVPYNASSGGGSINIRVIT